MSLASDSLKVPPHDIEAEKSVLGGILLDTSAMNIVAEFMHEAYFYTPEHQMIYAAMTTLFEKQQPIDIVTLKNELQHHGTLKKVGASYIAELINAVPSSANIEQYGKIVKDHFTKRKLIEMSSRITERAFDDSADTTKLLDGAETDIFALSQQHMHQDFIPLKDILTESFERLEEFMKNGSKFRGVATGFSDLDFKLSGLQDSNLIVLAARPGVGKSSLALNIALHAGVVDKKGVGFFSLEMSKEELVDRLLVGQADIDAWRLKTGKLSDDDYKKLTEAMGDLADGQIFIDDTPGISIMEMRTKARKLKIEHDIKLIVVDYLQLADPGKHFDSRVQEVSYISLGLKNLARELHIPVLALSQLSRAVEQRGTKKPQLADLRDSGAIEQDADVVMFIYQEDESEDLLDQSKRMMKLFIAKHRNGATGEIDLMFRGDRVKFYTVEKSL